MSKPVAIPDAVRKQFAAWGRQGGLSRSEKKRAAAVLRGLKARGLPKRRKEA